MISHPTYRWPVVSHTLGAHRDQEEHVAEEVAEELAEPELSAREVPKEAVGAQLLGQHTARRSVAHTARARARMGCTTHQNVHGMAAYSD